MRERLNINLDAYIQKCEIHPVYLFFFKFQTTFSTDVTRGLVDTCLHVQKSEKNPDGSSWLTDEIIQAIIIDVVGGGLSVFLLWVLRNTRFRLRFTG